jgi:hypothetical protein
MWRQGSQKQLELGHEVLQARENAGARCKPSKCRVARSSAPVTTQSSALKGRQRVLLPPSHSRHSVPRALPSIFFVSMRCVFLVSSAIGGFERLTDDSAICNRLADLENLPGSPCPNSSDIIGPPCHQLPPTPLEIFAIDHLRIN